MWCRVVQSGLKSLHAVTCPVLLCNGTLSATGDNTPAAMPCMHKCLLQAVLDGREVLC